jgi:hypothetical protein
MGVVIDDRQILRRVVKELPGGLALEKKVVVEISSWHAAMLTGARKERNRQIHFVGDLF